MTQKESSNSKFSESWEDYWIRITSTWNNQIQLESMKQVFELMNSITQVDISKFTEVWHDIEEQSFTFIWNGTSDSFEIEISYDGQIEWLIRRRENFRDEWSTKSFNFIFLKNSIEDQVKKLKVFTPTKN